MKKKKLIQLILGIIVLIAIFLPGFAKLQELKEENRSLKRRIEMLKRTNEELSGEKEKLEEDPEYMEKIAREKLGMTKEGEIILK